MNRKLVNSVAAAAIVFIVTVVTASAQVEPSIGGYSSFDETDANVVKAAKFAVKERNKKAGTKYKLMQTAQAERQIVSGWNYRLCLQVRNSNKETSYAEAVVWVNLENKRALISWEARECR